jgi:glutamate/tyrosine decarboxylase-like PLP-dependent enzyme
MATTYGNNNDAIGAWFLGPHAENFDVLGKIFQGLLYEQGKARAAYFPNDDDFITPSMKASTLFQKNISKLKYVIEQLAPRLAAHSVPFWNPRYNAHMNMDTTMPGMAGYLMAMMYNPNNVAIEASPLTTVLEIQVGQQLSEMVGYNIDITKSPVAWGHVTCDGSVANLESMWAARNLKFYPLSLRLAMETGGPLEFIADTFRLRDNDESLFKDLTSWQLLNIPPSVVLDIPDRLREKYHITSQFLQTNLKGYLVQTVGKDSNIFQKFNTDETKLNEMVYFVSAAVHYSWPKAAAVVGIGSENVIDVNVDDGARIDVKDLEARLKGCLKAKRAVYAVVAIIGSTEHGACDPLDEIVKLRDSEVLKDLGFVLHADGAWGAYFCSTQRKKDLKYSVPGSFVPAIALKPSTVHALNNLKSCDSITIDPHKSGYIQYPAGGLLYRDQRMRYLVTWTSPIVYRNELESIGIYGIEGSKPGAAPVATWVSHEVIGLHDKGYGALLGEAVFSCVKMYAHLATMSTDTTDFIVTSMNALPSNTGHDDLKQFIRDRILDVDNKDLVKDQDAMNVVIEMGSDLAINAFAVNFRKKSKGEFVVNEDVVEANYLGKRIFERLSISKITDSVPSKPLILTSTQLTQDSYKTCLTDFKTRLGLVGDQDLYVLVNVVMSPFPTEGNFTREIADSLQEVIKEEVETSRYRNEVTRDFHGFVIQGTKNAKTVFLVHLPMFNMANHRYQLIITGDLPTDVMTKYKQARLDFPDQYFTLGNARKQTLTALLANEKFKAVIDKGLPPSDGTHFITGFELTNIKVVVQKPLDSKYLAATYPKVGMPFYLYGSTQDKEYHIDHTLTAAPNTQFTAGEVDVALNNQSDSLPTFSDDSPYIKIIVDLPERAMQPFPSDKDIANDPDFFFRPNKVLPFKFTAADGTDVTGTLTLTENVFVDSDMLNDDPVPPKAANVDTSQGTRRPTTHRETENRESADWIPHLNAPHLDTVAPGGGWQDIITSIPRPYDQ